MLISWDLFAILRPCTPPRMRVCNMSYCLYYCPPQNECSNAAKRSQQSRIRWARCAPSTTASGKEKEHDMDEISTLERLFRYKAQANDEILATMQLFDDISPAKEIAIRALSHTYVVDQIFAANLTGAEHAHTSANNSQAP